jgi:phage regulator Rha-like protein
MELINNKDLQSKIFTIRGIQVMLDRDLAELFNVEVKRLNEQVKRNIDRFPENFRFSLIDHEKNELVAICDRFKSLKYSSNNSFAFTEQGVAMLSAVLRSETAVKVSIEIINAFVEMRKIINNHNGLLQRIEGVERKLLESDHKFEQVFKALNQNVFPTHGIFFDGQLFDAYVFATDLIKSAQQSIILIDNYIDETTLLMLSKRKSTCKAVIYTQKTNSQIQLDLAKYNQQYPSIELKPLKNTHDRFMILDNKSLYHIGASLKDLGNKWFAFSRIDEFLPEILTKLGE